MSALNIAFACYLAALSAYAAAYLFARPAWRRAGLAALIAAWAMQTVFLVVRWQSAGHAPLANQFESLASMSWFVVALAVCLRRLAPGAWLEPATSALNLILLGLCALLDSSAAPLLPALQSNWLLLHVSVILLGYASLALSFLASIVHLVGASSETDDRAATLDRFNERAMGLGYLLLTAGILMGSVWANEAWGSYWSWDPKETWSLATWLVYTAAVHLRRVGRWRGRRMAWLSVAGFCFVLFPYFGVNFLLGGLHSYAD